MPSEPAQLQAAIAALEAQRETLGHAVVDALLAPARASLTSLIAAAEPAPQQALRQVSILFIDVVGSTAMSLRLDPEDVHAVMDGALSQGALIVGRHGGRVLQFAGDNLLACFGADGTREDDAERAVRCGLALLAIGQPAGIEQPGQQRPAGFQVRVGIHTGSVLLGGGVDADGTIRGAAVNMAARMEQTAPAASLRISHTTFAQVRGQFEVQAQPPMIVKGVAEPVLSYLVQGLMPAPWRATARGIEGMPTRTIGRQAELQALQSAFGQLFAQRRLTAVTVVAEAGVGKSRLLHDFDVWARAQPERCTVFRGRAIPQTQGRPFGLLRDLVARHCQITDDDGLDQARAKLSQAMLPYWLPADGPELAESHVHLLGHLIGIDWRSSRHVSGILDDPRQIRNRALHAAAQWFRHAASAPESAPASAPASGPASAVMLQLEDLHWADSESLGFLDHLVDVNRDVALLLLGFTRPALFERPLGLQFAQGGQRRIDMAALGAADGLALADELLRRLGGAAETLRELIAGRAEGNPFFMEELVKMLIDLGAIETGPERWTLHPDRLVAAQVPPALIGVLQARLDSLPAAERHTLQRASVIGQVFWDHELTALDPLAEQTLPALVRRELVLPRPEAGPGSLRQYAFKHQILQQVTYDTVLKRDRRVAHAAVARWLSAQPGAHQHDLIAEHFERAGEPAQAVGHWQQAADGAADRHANAAALSHAQRALDLLPADAAERRYALTLLCTKVLRTLAERERLAQCLADLASLAEQLGDPRRRSEAAERRARFLNDGGDPNQAMVVGLQALAWAPADAPECAARAHLLLASAQAILGHPGQALQHAKAGLLQARRSGLPAVEAMLLNHLGMDANDRGDPGAAIHLFEQALVHHRQANNRGNEAATLNNLGYAALVLGQYPAAQAQFEAAVALCHQIGQRQIEGVLRINLALVRQCLGDAAGALASARQALQLLQQAGDRVGQAAALRAQGHAALAMNELVDAAAAFRASRDLYDALGLPHLAIESMAGQALQALACQDLVSAGAHVDEILRRQAGGAGLAGTDEPLRIGLICHQVLAALGDARAQPVLAHTHADLMARAGLISDPVLRSGFVEQVPWHRALQRDWQQHQWQQHQWQQRGAD